MSWPFLDSNIILYLLSTDVGKADRAEMIIAAGGIVSVQVLNEVTAVCLCKLRISWPEIDAVLAAVKVSCDVLPLTIHSHEAAVSIAKRYSLAFYEAHICAVAVLSGTDLLLSEDMQDGMLIDGVMIRNPFRQPE